MKSQCKKILRHLADMVEFDLRTMENGHIGAQTQMLKAELSPSSTEFFPRGRRSEIAVNKSIYDRLVYHTKALQSPPPGTYLGWVEGLFECSPATSYLTG